MDAKEKNKIHEEVTSDLPGNWGQLEGFLRRFKSLAFIGSMLPVAVIYVVCIGVALFPGLYIGFKLYSYFYQESLALSLLLIGILLALGYVLFALTLPFVVAFFNLMIPKPKQVRGNWYSLSSIPWYYHNALVQLVRYTVLDIITPSPLNLLFFKMMGMKMGKNCVINTSNISDPCLIELGDYVTIGGSATIFAHYGMGGYLVISKTKIGSYSTVGLKASIMGDVEIGENCMISPHAAVLPKTRLADGEKL